jgi:hypothetical protein
VQHENSQLKEALEHKESCLEKAMNLFTQSSDQVKDLAIKLKDRENLASLRELECLKLVKELNELNKNLDSEARIKE